MCCYRARGRYVFTHKITFYIKVVLTTFFSIHTYQMLVFCTKFHTIFISNVGLIAFFFSEIPYQTLVFNSAIYSPLVRGRTHARITHGSSKQQRGSYRARSMCIRVVPTGLPACASIWGKIRQKAGGWGRLIRYMFVKTKKKKKKKKALTCAHTYMHIRVHEPTMSYNPVNKLHRVSIGWVGPSLPVWNVGVARVHVWVHMAVLWPGIQY